MILDDKYFSMCLCSYINTTKVILTLIVPVYQGLYFAPIYKIFIYISLANMKISYVKAL
jgi:hypothetical protein